MPQGASPRSVLLQLAAVTALVAVIGVGVAVGTSLRTGPQEVGPLAGTSQGPIAGRGP